jgi:hydrogenase expression/formation protein HypE
MLGEVGHDRLITPRGAKPGDAVLLTKWVPIEATSILGTDFVDRLQALTPDDIAWAQGVLDDPGISVVRDARLAAEAGGVSAMHDPTEGGLAGGLWEMAEAAEVGVEIDVDRIPVPEPARRMCDALDVDPLSAIASGALLITAQPDAVGRIQSALTQAAIPVTRIGEVVEGRGVRVRADGRISALPQPPRDSIARLFEASD